MFFDDHGLLNSRPDEKNAENSFLWSVEYFFERLKRLKPSKSLESDISKALDNMRIGPGLYKQHPAFPHPSIHGTKDAYMSHDQLTAIVCFLLYTNQKDKIKEIVKVFVKQKGQYDNVHPENPGQLKKRYHHPRDLAFYYLASLTSKDLLKPWVLLFSSLSLLMLWVALIVTAITTYKYRDFNNDGEYKEEDGEIILKTDGLLLHRIRHYVMPKIFLPIDWFVELIVKIRFGGWIGVDAQYFKYDNNPIRKLYDVD